MRHDGAESRVVYCPTPLQADEIGVWPLRMSELNPAHIHESG